MDESRNPLPVRVHIERVKTYPAATQQDGNAMCAGRGSDHHLVQPARLQLALLDPQVVASKA